MCFKEDHVSGVIHTDVLTVPPGLAETPAVCLIFLHFDIYGGLFVLRER